ncbi:MAG TPA: CRISPR-associated endonuclease Cas2 [Candidatus Nanoarchaeia archaeon]|nr:CRISPR-associated endonuclease Cas2 [Candidatus Nanoarchaeia archaeon]
MYYIIVYDVKVERVNRLHKCLKEYLNWIQNSVFEGELGDADYVAVKKRINEIIDKTVDSVIMIKLRDKYSFQKEVIGKERNPVTNIL